MVKLVDFGLVKILDDEAHLTQTGMVCGTPHYMSPEQATNKPLDLRSDLYSLGVTYYELLTGQMPFNANSVPQILQQHISEAVPDPRKLIPGIPASCVAVINRAMDKLPAKRYQNAGEMGAALEKILAGISIRNASIYVMETAAPNISNSSQAGKSADGAGSSGSLLGRRGLLLGLGVLGGLGLFGAGGFLFRKREPGPEPVAGQVPGSNQTPKSGASSGLPAIKVGILHSLSGPLAISERPLADASLMAIEEINAKGGLLGRQLEPTVLDGRSEVTNESAFAHAAERLLTRENVAVVFGGYGSAGRKVIRPAFEKYDKLLFYPAQYEGLEESPNIIYTGATPNQLVIPAVRWCFASLHTKRFYLIGTDGLRARAINAMVEDAVKELGGEVVGTHYEVVGEYQFATMLKSIEKAKPELIINMLVGDSLIAFFHALIEANISAATLPVLSLALGENELAQLGRLNLSGHYVARTRFQSAGNGQEPSFSLRFKQRYGEHRPVSEIMESAYYGVYLWAAAVKRAGSEDPDRVRTALREQEYELPGVRVRVDPSNQHTWQVFELGKIGTANSIEIIKTGDPPIPPIPFPGPRTRAEWQSFSDELYERWGENWANPQKPRLKKTK